jgi:glycine hydroxymethyltransferase
MIASENFVSEAVLEAAGSVFTNKYAEGYPGRATTAAASTPMLLRIWRATAPSSSLVNGVPLHVNVQPHSGSQANAAAYMAVLEHGDTILGPRSGAWRPSDAWAQAELQRQALSADFLHGSQRHGE